MYPKQLRHNPADPFSAIWVQDEAAERAARATGYVHEEPAEPAAPAPAPPRAEPAPGAPAKPSAKRP